MDDMHRQPSPGRAPIGYDDTPMLPGSQWRVHDGTRPQPRIVDPGTASTQDRPGRPPSDAIVLFDGTDTSAWVGRDGDAVQWRIVDGAMEVVPRTGSIQTRAAFGDCHLHVEWATPAEVKGNSQGRGNSGVFLMAKYEIQVLDSYDNLTYADGHAGAIYGQYPPLVNASRGPSEWQTFDIFFIAARFEGQRLVSPAYATVVHNGVLIHLHREIQGPTGHKIVASYDEPHGPTGPVVLQDHGDLVRYRNIWVRPIELHGDA
jgi:hypothetical protein